MYFNLIKRRIEAARVPRSYRARARATHRAATRQQERRNRAQGTFAFAGAVAVAPVAAILPFAKSTAKRARRTAKKDRGRKKGRRGTRASMASVEHLSGATIAHHHLVTIAPCSSHCTFLAALVVRLAWPEVSLLVRRNHLQNHQVHRQERRLERQ